MTQANPDPEQDNLRPGVWPWVVLVIVGGLVLMGIVELATTFRIGI